MILANLWLIGAGAALVGLLMLVLWLIHLLLRNASIVDPGWAGGLAMLAILYALLGPAYPPRAWLLALMAGAWGLRLSLFLLFTRVIGHPEEGRYVELRRKWQTNVPLRFLLFFQFQAATCVVLSIPFFLTTVNPAAPLSPLEFIAFALWLTAFAGECTADAQLHAFKSNPANKGKTCREGLWNYSRHPNYFFEWLIWVSFALFATASPYGFIAWLCPALMLYFLFRVTGIPATEAQALRTKGEDYRRYQQSTSAFIPWFPKGQHG